MIFCLQAKNNCSLWHHKNRIDTLSVETTVHMGCDVDYISAKSRLHFLHRLPRAEYVNNMKVYHLNLCALIVLIGVQIDCMEVTEGCMFEGKKEVDYSLQ